jgi:2-dehydropantoate 2-reductase
MTTKLVIVGAGAMGSLIAALLTEGGLDVTTLDNHPERAAIVNEKGLRVQGVSGDRTVRFRAETDPRRLPRPDVVIICTKAYDTAKAAADVREYVPPETPFLTLQNGLGNVEALAETVGAQNVLAGTINQGANEAAYGSIRHAGVGPTIIGEASGPATDRVRALAETLTAAGLPAADTDDVKALQWGKLVVNAGINALGAVLQIRNGGLLRHEETERLMELAVAEAVKVAKAAGVKLPYDGPLEHVRKVARDTSENINSMLADILRNKRTEIEAINGAVAAEGKRLGVQTPVSEFLFLLVKSLEKTTATRATLKG